MTLDSNTAPSATGLGPEERLAALGLKLPPAPAPVANFVAWRRSGPLLYLSGQGPLEADGHLHVGRVGEEVSIEAAYAHARLTGLNLLAVAKAALGDLKRVRSVVKLLAFVNAAPGFAHHPKVINGCSDLFVEVFGDEVGRGARSAIGAGSLPGHQTVEVEAILEVD
ncbi:Enamine deaminase RidA, house cleaning of reactive enamine intermediates, YjgF/YER057c/UK114 family [Variovorax sp. YR266]|uniref:RidA family protein n=1 Tax=Variovorax sp. YR266 TaxID=1884386 RepID=UPI000895EA17|nr:RidA family protein [Variovorax sp. YR266]SDZ70702.1 Enamine deaminase RidA, house cleaning of reactive enamine intermediates, YjgF/YER057c/UK114 family [Variovorax sp. YR266]